MFIFPLAVYRVEPVFSMVYKAASLLFISIVTLTLLIPATFAQDPVIYLKNYKIDPAVSNKLINSGYVDAIIILNSYEESVKEGVASIVGSDNVIRMYENIPYIYAEIDLDVLPKLVASASVIAIAPNMVFKKAIIDRPVILGYDKLQASAGVASLVNWGLFRTGTIAVWREFNVTGDGIIIAILDTGVNIAHPLIKGKMFSINSSDPSYPGGWIEFDSRGKPVCSSPHDTDGHGSWVTSIAVGGDTSNILIGYAPRAMYIHALVLPTGSGTFAQVLAGIDWAAEPYLCNGTKVSSILGRSFRPNIVSMSFGSEGNYSNYLLPAIRRLLELGIIPVAAIGNGGVYTSSNPGNIWGVFGVGSIERDDTVSLFSSGEQVEWPDPPRSWPFKGTYPREYYKPDFVLPAVMIPGAYISEELIAIGSGTSAAAPSLSGILALALQAMRVRGINASPITLYDLLTETSYKVNNMSRIRYGNGIVNSFTLIASILGYRLSTIEGSSDSEVYRVGLGGSFSIKGFQGFFTLYLDDQRFQGLGGTAFFTVPPSDYGDHYIHAFSLERGVYSYGRIRVEPSISIYGGFYPTSTAPVSPTYMSGSEVFLRLDGFPAVELIVIRYLSSQLFNVMGDIIAIDYPNLRGRIDLSVRLPYVNASQIVYIVASDLVGLVGASISISISPPQPQMIVIATGERLQLLVSGPQTAYLGRPVNISIYSYREGRSVESNITAYVYHIDSAGSTPSLVFKVQRISDSLRIALVPNNTGIYVVWVTAYISSTFVGESMYAIRVIPYEEADQLVQIARNLSALSIQVAGINSTIERIMGIVTALMDSYTDLVGRYVSLYRSVDSLGKELNETKKELQKTQESLTIALKSIEELGNVRTSMWIAIAMAMMALASMIIVILSIRRKPYR